MRTIRRLYFYAIAFVSLEVVLWGLIELARSAFVTERVITSSADRLAQALALILVGVPVFGFHWWMAQRDAARDADEHASGVRAAFLYAALLGTLIPVVQNFIALANRLLLGAANMDARMAFIGGAQTWSDNLIALFMNALVAAYFITVVRGDWKGSQPKESLAFVRRIYRYVWMLYGLILLVAGMQQTLRVVLDLAPGPSGTLMRTAFVNGITLLVAGALIWFFAWKTIQDSLAEPEERESLLRLGILYFLSLAGVLVVLTAAGIVVDTLLRLAFGQSMTLQQVFRDINGPLSIGIPLAGVWAYYGHWLGRTMSETPDTERRAGMRRLYFYILSAIGLSAAFSGLAALVSFLLDRLLLGTAQLGTLTRSLALLITGLPLWLLTWRPMQAEALAAGDAGDHARRSILRKIYLYLALFVSVVGGMITAVSLLYQLLRALLGQPGYNLLETALDLACLLLLFIGLGVYHGLTLGRDGKLASAALTARHAAFPVILFDPGDGTFARDLAAAIQKQTPRLPVTILPAGQPVAKDAAPQAVLLPADVALDPPESLRRWLSKYNGSRLAVPRAAGGWVLTGAPQSDFNQAALALRHLAEGHEVRQKTGTSAWMIVVYIAAGLFGCQMLLGLLSMVMSFLLN
ncbi:MAG: hypothetical protein FD146_210 [Anaerolineaceae bacterium]|nr:MAG: hypothetical protein FD146_210 [Anaerolineaceae bacterium]